MSVMFGTFIRGRSTEDLRKFRYDQLKKAYHKEAFTQKADNLKYGSCAETYLFICNIRRYVSVEDYILNPCIMVIVSRRFLT
jgi:hypothetical protein